MMNMIKRIVAVALLLALALSLTGCESAPDACEACRQEGKLSKVKVAGETVWLCNSCKSLAEMFGVMP